MAESIEFEIRLKDLMSKGLADINNKLNGIENNLNDINRTGKKVGSKSGGLGVMGVALGGIAANLATQALSGIWELGKGIVSLGIDAEQTRASFEVMLGSVEAADKHLSELKAFAAATPFGFTELADSTKMLKGYGVATEKLMPILSMLGDVSRGNKEKLNGLSLVFGQISAAGKLNGQDLNQLITNGFNPLGEIAKRTGKSIGQLKEEMSKGAISADMVTQAFIDATSKGGQFYQMMDKQSKTVGGRKSTLQDQIKAIGLGISESVLPIVGKLVDNFAYFFSWIKENFEQLKNVFYPLWDAVQPIVDLIRSIAIDLGLANSEGSMLAGIFNTIGTVIKVIAPISKALFTVWSQIVGLIVSIPILIFKAFKGVAGFINKLLPKDMQIKMPDFGFKEPKESNNKKIMEDIEKQKADLLGGGKPPIDPTKPPLKPLVKPDKTLSNEVAKVQSRQPSNVYINIDAIIKGDVNNMINNANNPQQDLNNFLVQIENALLSVVNDVNLAIK